MANIDILNPVTKWSDDLGFNPNWAYGSPQSMGDNYSTARPRFGRWQSRTTGDAGYSFDLTFVGPIEQMRYLKRFYNQFSRGFFTLIDYGDNSREYVGRFTKFKDNTEQKNLVYVAHATFECIPGAPMRNYPTDFSKWGYPIWVTDDWIASPYETGLSGSAVGTQGAEWTLQQTPSAITAGAPVSDPSSYMMFDTNAVADDFATIEYAGWGFTVTWQTGGALGICNILVDGFETVSLLDLYTGLYGGTPGPFPVAAVTTSVLGAPLSFSLTVTGLPLGTHRVKIIATGTKNAGSSATSIYMPSIQVIG